MALTTQPEHGNLSDFVEWQQRGSAIVARLEQTVADIGECQLDAICLIRAEAEGTASRLVDGNAVALYPHDLVKVRDELQSAVQMFSRRLAMEYPYFISRWKQEADALSNRAQPLLQRLDAAAPAAILAATGEVEAVVKRHEQLLRECPCPEGVAVPADMIVATLKTRFLPESWNSAQITDVPK